MSVQDYIDDIVESMFTEWENKEAALGYPRKERARHAFEHIKYGGFVPFYYWDDVPEELRDEVEDGIHATFQQLAKE